MALYRDEGVVLRTFRLGEADRIVTIATPLHGKVRAVVKGVRRTKSRIGGRVEPLSHVKLLCWKGRELDIVTGVEVIDSFPAIRNDLDRTLVAMTMLEIVDRVAVEHHAMSEVFTLLVGALRTLEAKPQHAILAGFCFKLLFAEGVGPVVDRCVSCSDTGELVAFDSDAGGLLCRQCRRGQAVSAPAIDMLRLAVGGRLSSALDLGDQDPATALELERLGITAVENHLDRRLKTQHNAIRPLTL